MQIHTLKLSVTDEEINAVLAELPQGDSTIENLRVRLTPEGIVVLGDYPTMLLKMAFETLWEVKGIGSVVEARLASIKVSGLPARMLRGVLLKTIRDMTAREPGFRVEDESIHLDLARHTGAQKVNLRVNLTRVQCDSGNLMIEAGPLIA